LTPLRGPVKLRLRQVVSGRKPRFWEREGTMRNTVGVWAVLAGLIVALAVTSQALADPVNGNNSTPGTLTCGQTVYQTTSGSDQALAIQVVGSTDVFAVKSVPDFGIDHGGGIPSDKLLSCTLFEPSFGIPLTVIGLFT
jgi:hypothetical protein